MIGFMQQFPFPLPCYNFPKPVTEFSPAPKSFIQRGPKTRQQAALNTVNTTKGPPHGGRSK